MNIFNKPLENLTVEDIKILVREKIPESQTLEYKEKGYANDREGKREILKDITSMANAYGGYIIIGIKEDSQGCAEEIIGIEEAEDEERKIMSLCLAHIKERIRGLKISHIPVAENKRVLVIYVPRSLYGPHMITFEDMNQFWIRHNTQKSLMSIEEIRDAFLRSKEMVNEIKEFINKRKNEIISLIEGQPYFVIGALPFPPLLEEIDTKNTELKKLLSSSEFVSPFPTLEGIKYGNNEVSWELFRNGYLEFKTKLEMVEVSLEKLNNPAWNESFRMRYQPSSTSNIKVKVIYPSWSVVPAEFQYKTNIYFIVKQILIFFKKLKEIRQVLGVEESYVVFIWMFNVKDTSITQNEVIENIPHLIWCGEIGFYDKPNLEISPREIYDFSDPKKIAKDFCERIFNAYGFKECPKHYLE